jgi:hypothetical protein
MSKPRTRIVLPDGQPVNGWREATKKLGPTRQTLIGRSQWSVKEQTWYVRPAKPIGRPRSN